MNSLFTQALHDLLHQECSASVVRQIEAQPRHRGLWTHLCETGFNDILLPESAGGAALPLEAAFELWALCGRFALPLPRPETQWARALLHSAGVEDLPAGPIGLGWNEVQAGQTLSVDVSAGQCCDHVLVSLADGLRLLPLETAQMQAHGLALDLRLSWSAEHWGAQPVLAPRTDLALVQALLAAAQLSGAMTAVFEQTLEYANQRQQFGKPIGRFQAIQHNLSILAEQVFAAAMAARLACQGEWSALSPLRVAVAKARTSMAAQQVTTLTHGLHGAIGFTNEFDLQLRTRRLYAWRQCAGAETHWQQQLGQAMLDRPSHSLDVLRELTDL